MDRIARVNPQVKSALKRLLPRPLINSIRLMKVSANLDDFYLVPKSGLTYAEDLLYTYHNADFMKDRLFIESYDLARQTDGGLLLANYDIRWRIHVLCWAAMHAAKLDGDFVDCGVSTGFCARAVIHFIGFEKLNKKYYLLDTFSGMDPRYSSEAEMKRNEILKYSKQTGRYEQVKKTFADLNAEVIRGPVPETLTQVQTDKVCYLSIDMNSVIPEVSALEYFWEKMVPGGMIVLDDYGYPGCIEQKTAHDAFARSKGTMVLSLPTCQGLIVK